ncbi:leucine-rich repeat-containing protein 56 [Colossoma macropomum]|uniref:leucine-rich repeat-containing protein 56 n=1 Tax=Colossoma macropomum TaxID=42526 RepID=UPI0018653DD4|nr:leucine-rich repeat-containing protein 56 [Colossoma macropomum]
MSCSQKPLPGRRPGTARSFVTEFDGSGQINPSPVTAVDTDLLVELYLSPEKLRSLSGSDDLDQVTTLEMCVDTRQNTLGNFGVYLPNLVQLKMNNSLILSVRDLGTTLSHIQVLSLVRCGLADLDGILSLSLLKELYVAYNNVSDLSQISMLEQLEMLDLEGNSVDDLVQVQYLGLCGQLRTLSLEGNPVCTCPHPGTSEVSEYNYRSAVRKLIPQLHYLDDAPAENEELCCSSTTTEDWTLFKESIKDSASITDSASDCLELIEERAASVCGFSRPCSAQRPGTSLSFSSLSSRPATARPPSLSTSSRPGSAGTDPDTPDHETSDLTHGVGRVLFCGNPLQAVRARRQKIKLQVGSSHSRPCTQLGSYVPEHTYDVEETSSQDRSSVFAELRAWREEHSKRLLAIEKDRQPQVLRIIHGDDDEEEEDDDGSSTEYDEGGHKYNPISDREEEIKGGRESTSHRYIDSPDSSFQSPSPDLSEPGALSPEVSRLSSLSDHTPSPPSRDMPPTSGGRIAEIRARRLRVSNASVGIHNPTGEFFLPNPTAARRDANIKAVNVETVKTQPVPPQILRKPHRPDSNPVISTFKETCAGPPEGNSLSIKKHEQIVRSLVPQRPTPTRPHTARAALQRLPGHRTLLPGRGSPHLD